MTWVVDIVLIVVVAVMAFVGFRKGIVKMLLSLLTVVLALVIAFVASAPLANVAYDALFEESISRTVDAALEEATDATIGSALEDLLSSDSLIGTLSGWQVIDTKPVTQAADQTVANVSRVIKNDVIRPPMVLLLRGVLFLLLALLLWIIFTLISKAIVRTAKLPVVRGINAVLGAAAGLLLGCVLCLGLTALFNVAADISPTGLMGISAITRDNSIVYRFISETVPLTLRS